MLQTLVRSIRSRLKAKSILAVVLLIIAISTTLTTFFLSRQRSSMMDELAKRALSLSGNLAFNSQYAVLSRDTVTIKTLISGVLKESEIERVLITDLKGQVLVLADSGGITVTPNARSSRLDMPSDPRWKLGGELDTLTSRRWYSTPRPDLWRAATLIEIERKTPENDEMLLFAPPTAGASSAGSAVLRQKLGFAVLDVSLASLHDALEAGTRKAVLISLLMVAGGSLITVLMVGHVAGPVFELAGATQAVARGDLDRKVSVEREDEIGVLAESFNNMIDQLKASREKIEAWNRELEASVQERTRELEAKHAELGRAYEALKTLDKAKDDFLSLVSHELRTPLSSILLYSEMLLDGLADSEESRTEFLGTIVDNCKRLTRLINDVLDLSKIEAGRMRFKLDKLEFRAVVADTLNGLKPSIEAKRIAFEYREIQAPDLRLWGDYDKVIQVLTNIVSNAVRFTPENGRISVELSRRDGMGLVTVSDTGKGIRGDDISKVFDRFGQLESIDHHSEGSGLGMTISKSIIERLGGEIWIESELGRGTTVLFTLLDADMRTALEGENEESDEPKPA
ncbi:cell wall metabolism sensor histidine kinase WalK [bacterium]|nr:cell wall metabolism sensor histidine kinase WalK [bacterium]